MNYNQIFFRLSAENFFETFSKPNRVAFISEPFALNL